MSLRMSATMSSTLSARSITPTYAGGARRVSFSTCAALIAAIALGACAGDDQPELSATDQRETESAFFIALAWEDLDAEQRATLCGLSPADLATFVDGLALADGLPPDLDSVREHLASVCD